MFAICFLGIQQLRHIGLNCIIYNFFIYVFILLYKYLLAGSDFIKFPACSLVKHFPIYQVEGSHTEDYLDCKLTSYPSRSTCIEMCYKCTATLFTKNKKAAQTIGVI